MVGHTPGSLSSSWRLARFRSTTESVNDGPPRPRCRGLARFRARPFDPPHHSRCGAIRASVAGPIPGTVRRSSTPENAPFSSRRRTILFAVAGPTPGRRSSSSSEAVLGSSPSSGDKGRLRRASSLLRSLLSARSLPVSEAAASYGVGLLGLQWLATERTTHRESTRRAARSRARASEEVMRQPVPSARAKTWSQG